MLPREEVNDGSLGRPPRLVRGRERRRPSDLAPRVERKLAPPSRDPIGEASRRMFVSCSARPPASWLAQPLEGDVDDSALMAEMRSTYMPGEGEVSTKIQCACVHLSESACKSRT